MNKLIKVLREYKYIHTNTESLKEKKGITLIALVITIIVLLILAGISIASLTGENGILGRASDSKVKTEIADIKEQIQTDIIGEQAGNTGDISDNALKEILEKYGTINYEVDGRTIKSITTTKGGYEIAMADIWSGTTNNSNSAVVGDGSWNGTVNTPKLLAGMTGVYWDESGKEVLVDGTNKDKWYDYSTTANESRWANAKTSDGSYWVWIPRYEYKITGTTVDVQFIEISKTKVDSGYTYIHPAFRNGSSTNYTNGEWKEEIPGFWVAKYEMSMETKGTSTITESAGVGNVKTSDTIKAVSKPGVTAWRNINISNSYDNAYNYDRSKESHLMKNSEWGAVAYLTQSSYGRNGTEITINGNSSFYTGGGQNATATTNVSQSTTGNSTGIFDMSGCSWERVAAYITNGDPILSNYGSSFVATTTPNGDGYKTLSNEYATVYPYDILSDSYENNWTVYNKLKTTTYGYGDAVLEISTSGIDYTSWNGDYSNFPNTGNPFFVRGGSYNDSTRAGNFAFSHSFGGQYYSNSFRTVLVGF